MLKNISTLAGLTTVVIVAAVAGGGIIASQYLSQPNPTPVIYTPIATPAPTSTATLNPTPTPKPTSAACAPKWVCDWGPCSNGYQALVITDSNKCGVSSAGVNIACAALARQCNAQPTTTTFCTPNIVCGWGACVNGYQQPTSTDTNNCKNVPVADDHCNAAPRACGIAP